MGRERKFLRSRTRSEEEQAAIAAVEAPAPEDAPSDADVRALKCVEARVEHWVSRRAIPGCPIGVTAEIVGGNTAIQVTLDVSIADVNAMLAKEAKEEAEAPE